MVVVGREADTALNTAVRLIPEDHRLYPVVQRLLATTNDNSRGETCAKTKGTSGPTLASPSG